MAKSKHNRTGKGTHRQRIHQYKLSIIEARKAAILAEIQAKMPVAPATFEVTDTPVEHPAPEQVS